MTAGQATLGGHLRLVVEYNERNGTIGTVLTTDAVTGEIGTTASKMGEMTGEVVTMAGNLDHRQKLTPTHRDITLKGWNQRMKTGGTLPPHGIRITVVVNKISATNVRLGTKMPIIREAKEERNTIITINKGETGVRTMGS